MQKCELYIPGHCPHWIQVKRAAGTEPRVGTLVEIVDGVITVEYLDKIGHYRNHDAKQLEDIAQPGTNVRVFEDYRILGVDVEHGSRKVFCIALPGDTWTPCNYEPLESVTPDALAARLSTHGGFSVPGHLLIGDIDD
jgi:hypothetical protein